MKISKLHLKRAAVVTKDFIKDYGVFLNLAVSILALGLSGYVLLRVNSGVLAAPGAVAAIAPEKIVKESMVKNAPYLGNPNAKVTVVEFSDFQCPYCYRFHSQVFQDLKTQYIDTGKIKFVYVDYAFLGQESKDAAAAAKCAADQGKFWQYHDELFANQRGENLGQFDSANLEKFAGNIGLDISTFKSCLSSKKYDKMVNDEFELGKKFGVNGTPKFLIGKQMINGAYGIEYFQKFIDSQL